MESIFPLLGPSSGGFRGGAWELKHPPLRVFLLKIINKSPSGKFLVRATRTRDAA